MLMRLFLAFLISLSSMSASTYVFHLSDWEPYMGRNLFQGGCVVQTIQQVCQEADIRCKFEWEDSWKRSWQIAMHGQSHGTLPWGQSDKRDREMLRCSEPVLHERRVGYYRKDAFDHPLNPQSYEDLKNIPGLKPVAIRGYIDEENFKKLDIPYHVVNNEELAWNLIKTGRVNFYIEDESVAKLAINNFEDPWYSQSLKKTAPLHSQTLYLYYTRINDDIVYDNKKLCEALSKAGQKGIIEEMTTLDRCVTK